MPKVRRDSELRVRVTEAEREAMQAAADAQGQTLSAWLRMAALAAAKAALRAETGQDRRNVK